MSIVELSRFSFCWLFCRFKFDGCRLSVDGSRLIVAGGAFFTLDFSRLMAGSFFALDDSLFRELGAGGLVHFSFLPPFTGDPFFTFCGIFVGDLVGDFIGLVSLDVAREFPLEPVRHVPFIFTLLDRRMGIFVGESVLHFLLILPLPPPPPPP